MVATELSLESGRLEARATRQLAPAGGMQVRTPVAVAGLRGTDFRLNVSDDGQQLRGELLDGGLTIQRDREEVRLTGGEGLLAEAGKPLGTAQPLPAAPCVIALPAIVRNLPIRFTWPADPASRQWRAQIAADGAFQKLQLDAQVDAPEVAWDIALPDGDYVFRLRALNAAGLEGYNLDHKFRLDLRPMPPRIQAPAPAARSYVETVDFVWDAAEEAQGYLIQIAPTPYFQTDVIERRLGAVTRQREVLPSGLWHWRLASLDADGGRHLWGPSQTLRVQPLPAAPVLSGATEADTARLSWLALSGAAQYDIEIASDPNLTTTTLHRRQVETELVLTLPPGQHFWRVRGVEADGEAGGWSAPGQLILPPPPPTNVVATITRESIELGWQGEAARYRVEMAKVTGFDPVLLKLDSPSHSTSLAKPEPGQYLLRVIAISADGNESLPSAAVPVEIKRTLPWWLWPLMLLPFGV